MNIHYESSGSGPAILFIHASIADSRMWRDQMTIEGYRCIVFDQRGFGQTPWVPESYADWEDAVAVMDAAGADSAVVVGCSLGGAVALHLALSVPDRVDGLVLVGAMARGWEPEGGWEEEEEFEAELMAAAEAGELQRVAEMEADYWLAGRGRSLAEMDQELVDLFIEMDLKPLTTEQERNEHVRPFDPPVNDRIDEIEVPTLVIIGERDEPLLIQSAGYLAATLSDRPAVMIPDSAHLPSLDQPVEFNRVLQTFLQGIP